MIRPANAADAAEIANIYNHYIKNTTITFEEIEVTGEEMARRIDNVTAAGLPWYVIEHNGKLAGYAYATKWRERSAYRFSVESTVYLKQEYAGQGLGKILYSRILDVLHDKGFHVVIGGIALPNEASTALHESLGFSKVAEFREVGQKFGRWINVGYWERVL